MNVDVFAPLDTVGRACASAGSIFVPPTPCTPRANVSSGVFTTEYSSVPWVVKSSPWSADSGAVPAAIVIVPPAWAAPLALLPELLPALLPGLLPELVDEELQAASATTAPQ